MPNYEALFSENLRRLRKMRGMTQKALVHQIRYFHEGPEISESASLFKWCHDKFAT